jgi:hypothetical protein
MATQLQATIIGVDSTTLPESKDLSFPMRSIFLVESGDGCIVKFKNKDYYSSDAISDLVSAELVQATVLRTNTSVLPSAKQMAFPGSDIVISATNENGASAIIEHDGVSYFVSEAPDDLVSDANAGGSSEPVEVVCYQLKTVLTDAQIKSLPTTFIEVVPAQGAGKLLIFHRAMIALISDTETYYTNVSVTDDDYMAIAYGDDSKTVSDGVRNGSVLQSTDVNFLLPFRGEPLGAFGLTEADSASASNCVNVPLKLIGYNAGGNLTGGHASNTLEVTVFYSIVDL